VKLSSTLILAASLCSVPSLTAQDNPFSADARQTYAMIKDSLLKAADKMPAEAYSFRTVPQVRTFAEMIAHVADGQNSHVRSGERRESNRQCRIKKHQVRTGCRAEGVV